VEALVIPPDQLRALLIAEAESGERIMRALILRRVGLLETGAGGPVIVGRRGNGDVLRLEGFLRRNGHPRQVLDPEADPEANALIERFHIDPGQLPMVLCPNGQLLRNPSEYELARCIRLVRPVDPARIYDVAMSGPALPASPPRFMPDRKGCPSLCSTAAHSAARRAPRLMARAYNQAQKFGVEMAIPDEVIGLDHSDDLAMGGFVLNLCNGERVSTRSAVIASGARYRRPAIEGLELFEDASVHYWASPLEAKLCAGQEVALVGAGNSAGQAAVYLSSQVSKVWLLVRGSDLATSMSRYLVDRIAGLSNVEVLTRTTVTGLDGRDGKLEGIRWRGGASRQDVHRPIQHLFLLIGAEPNTNWLSGSGVELDAKGFVSTGADTAKGRHPLETSRRGIFAIGDVRSGSVKRVAAAVGEGAQVVAALHSFLGGSSTRPTDSPSVQ